MTAKDIYTVEYSVYKNAYHIDTLDRLLENNRQLCRRREYNGYVPIAIFSNYEDAKTYVEWKGEEMPADYFRQSGPKDYRTPPTL